MRPWRDPLQRQPVPPGSAKARLGPEVRILSPHATNPIERDPGVRARVRATRACACMWVCRLCGVELPCNLMWTAGSCHGELQKENRGIGLGFWVAGRLCWSSADPRRFGAAAPVPVDPPSRVARRHLVYPSNPRSLWPSVPMSRGSSCSYTRPRPAAPPTCGVVFRVRCPSRVPHHLIPFV